MEVWKNGKGEWVWQTPGCEYFLPFWQLLSAASERKCSAAVMTFWKFFEHLVRIFLMRLVWRVSTSGILSGEEKCCFHNKLSCQGNSWETCTWSLKTPWDSTQNTIRFHSKKWKAITPHTFAIILWKYIMLMAMCLFWVYAYFLKTWNTWFIYSWVEK